MHRDDTTCCAVACEAQRPHNAQAAHGESLICTAGCGPDAARYRRLAVDTFRHAGELLENAQCRDLHVVRPIGREQLSGRHSHSHNHSPTSAPSSQRTDNPALHVARRRTCLVAEDASDCAGKAGGKGHVLQHKGV